MNYRALGRTGLCVSELSIGSWATVGEGLGDDSLRELLEVAYSEGVNHFDTAEVYGDGQTELALGRALKSLGWNRQTYLITTKVMWGTGLNRPNTFGLSRKHVIEGCRASLRRLGLDYVDFLLCHRPDEATPVEETVAAIGNLLASGEILYWGMSEWPVEMINEAIKIADASGIRRPVIEQSQYNLFERRRVEFDLQPMTAHGVGICGWSPLLYGMLAGRKLGKSRVDRPDMKWLREIALPTLEREARLAVIEAFNVIADDVGLSPAGAALCWCLANDSVSSIISGASRITQFRSNISELAKVRDRVGLRREIEDRLEAHGWRFDDSANSFKAVPL